MYKNFYKLNSNPFSLTVNSSFTLETEKFSEGFFNIMYGIEKMEGVVTITGNIGTGKTTLCNFVSDKIQAKNKDFIISITDPLLLEDNIINIYRFINESKFVDESNLLYENLNEHGNGKLIHIAFRDILINLAKRNKKPVLIIDEADKLSMKMLKNISFLSNMEHANKKLIQIVLVGEPGLITKLNLPELSQLNQRVSVRYNLKELNIKETKEYIYHRMKMAGDSGVIRFPKNSIKTIYKNTNGCQRLINLICDRALLQAMLEKSVIIKKSIINLAIRDLNIKPTRKRFNLRILINNNNIYRALAFSVTFFIFGISTGLYTKIYNKNDFSSASIPAIRADVNNKKKVLNPSLDHSGFLPISTKQSKENIKKLPELNEHIEEDVIKTLNHNQIKKTKAETEQNSIALVLARIGRIRKSPSFDSDTIIKVKSGTILTKVKTLNGWTEVQIPGKEQYGWIKNSIIALNPKRYIKGFLISAGIKSNVAEMLSNNIEDTSETKDFKDSNTMANTQAETKNNVSVITGRARIRDLPSTSSNIITLIDYGEILDKVEDDGAWSKVRIPGTYKTYGWISNSLIKKR